MPSIRNGGNHQAGLARREVFGDAIARTRLVQQRVKRITARHGNLFLGRLFNRWLFRLLRSRFCRSFRGRRGGSLRLCHNGFWRRLL